VNGIDGNHASLSQAGESGDNYLTTGCKRHGAVKCDRRSVFLIPNPSGSQGGGQLAMGGTSCRDIYFAKGEVNYTFEQGGKYGYACANHDTDRANWQYPNNH